LGRLAQIIMTSKTEVIQYLNKIFNLNIKRLSRGQLYDPWFDPISNTLHHSFDKNTLIETGWEYLVVRKQRYVLPDNVKEFIKDFDAGKYPELITDEIGG